MSIDELVAAWRDRPKESREAVLSELQETVVGWSKSAYDDDTRCDAETFEIVLKLLRAAEP